VERLSHDCILAEDTFQSINNPVAAGRQRASGLRLADPRVHSLLHALVLFRQLADGFRCADLRRHFAALSGRDPQSLSQGAITYQLRRLRLHGFIERLPNTFRYRVTEFGFRASLFLTRAYNRLPRIGGCNSGPAQRDQLSQSRLRKNHPRDRRIYPTSCIRPIQNLTHLAHVS
jgi:hypothetical protein